LSGFVESEPVPMKFASHEDLAWVAAQCVLLAALLFAPPFGVLPMLAPLRPLGLVVCAAGLVVAAVATWQLHAGRSLTPMPSPRGGAALLTGGMYRRMRHPVYGGLLIWAFGVAVAAASLLHLTLFALLWIFLTAKATREERMLARKFGDYAGYAARTPRFLPLPSHRR